MLCYSSTTVQSVFVPAWIFESDLSQQARWLYVTMLTCSGKKDHCFPSQETLANRTKMSVSSVKTYLTELQEKGFLGIKRSKYNNTYFFLAHPAIRSSNTDSQNTAPDSQDSANSINNNINNNTKYPPTPQRRPAGNTGGGDFSNCKFFGKGNATNLNTMVTRALCTDFAQKSTAAVDPDFEAVWNAYPKKTGGYATTYALWMELKPDKALKERILRAISLQKNNPDWLRDDGHWIPTLKNWLLERGWMNEPSSEQASAKPETQVDYYAALASRPAPGFSLPAMPPPPPGAISYREFLKLQKKEQSTCRND